MTFDGWYYLESARRIELPILFWIHCSNHNSIYFLRIVFFSFCFFSHLPTTNFPMFLFVQFKIDSNTLCPVFRSFMVYGIKPLADLFRHSRKQMNIDTSPKFCGTHIHTHNKRTQIHIRTFTHTFSLRIPSNTQNNWNRLALPIPIIVNNFAEVI